MCTACLLHACSPRFWLWLFFGIPCLSARPGAAAAAAHAPHLPAAATTATAQLSLLLCGSYLLLSPSAFIPELPASSTAGMAAQLALACADAYFAARCDALFVLLGEYGALILERGFDDVPSLPALDAQLGAAAARAVCSPPALRWACFGGAATCTVTAMSLLLSPEAVLDAARTAAAAAVARGGWPTLAASVAAARTCLSLRLDMSRAALFWVMLLRPCWDARVGGALWPWEADARLGRMLWTAFGWRSCASGGTADGAADSAGGNNNRDGTEDARSGSVALGCNMWFVLCAAARAYHAGAQPSRACYAALWGLSFLFACLALLLTRRAHPQLRSCDDVDDMLLRVLMQRKAVVVAAAAAVRPAAAASAAALAAAWRSPFAECAARYICGAPFIRVGAASLAWLMRLSPLPTFLVGMLLVLVRCAELAGPLFAMHMAVLEAWWLLRVEATETKNFRAMDVITVHRLPAEDQEAYARQLHTGWVRATQGHERAQERWSGLPRSTRALACAANGIAVALLLCAAWMARGALYWLLCLLVSADVRWAVSRACTLAGKPLSPLLNTVAAKLASMFSHRRAAQVLVAACAAPPLLLALRDLSDLRALPRAFLVRPAHSVSTALHVRWCLHALTLCCCVSQLFWEIPLRKLDVLQACSLSLTLSVRLTADNADAAAVAAPALVASHVPPGAAVEEERSLGVLAPVPVPPPVAPDVDDPAATQAAASEAAAASATVPSAADQSADDGAASSSLLPPPIDGASQPFLEATQPPLEAPLPSPPSASAAHALQQLAEAHARCDAEALKAIMMAHLLDAEVQARGCIALADRDFFARGLLPFDSTGLVAWALAGTAMSTHHKHAVVQQHGCDAVACLLTFVGARLSEDKLSLLVLSILIAMHEHAANARVQQHACGALLKLAQPDDEHPARDGVIDTVLTALRRHGSDAGV